MCSMLYIPSLGKIGEKGIDFECGRQEEKLYVQAAYLLADKSSVRLEFGAYDTVKDNFPEYAVTMDELDMSRNGIKHCNIRDFLTAAEWR